MAKKASPAKSAASGRKRAPAKAKTTARKPARKAASAKSGSRDTAVDALLKLLESPLVADLFAVGASAALAAITESRHSRRTGADAKSSKTAKAAGKAAAAAIGRRLSTEFDEIKKAAKKPRTTAKS
ncbi:MAG: hypothetical protein ABIO69_07215 [Sphingomicrobium sp.]